MPIRNATPMRQLLCLIAAMSITSIAGCGSRSVLEDGGPGDATPTPAQLDDLRDRWNAAAGQITIDGGTGFDFTWTPDAFPAPTFRDDGSHASYEQFAEILVLFYATADNLSFAKENGLLTYGFSDGLTGDPPLTLQGMTIELTQGYSSYIQPSTLSQLIGYCPQVGCD